jgi:hypothetical protein
MKIQDRVSHEILPEEGGLIVASVRGIRRFWLTAIALK